MVAFLPTVVNVVSRGSAVTVIANANASCAVGCVVAPPACEILSVSKSPNIDCGAFLVQNARQWKDGGNEAFKVGEFQMAIGFYTAGLALDFDACSKELLSNRSLANLKMGYHEVALRDAQECVRIAPSWPKGKQRLQQMRTAAREARAKK